MSHVWIKKTAWNKILNDIVKIRKLADSKPEYRLYFYGIEVYSINYARAKSTKENEWLSILICAVGKTCQNPVFDRQRGITVNTIAAFDKWYMEEKEIRERLSHLEVRKVDTIKTCGEK